MTVPQGIDETAQDDPGVDLGPLNGAWFLKVWPPASFADVSWDVDTPSQGEELVRDTNHQAGPMRSLKFSAWAFNIASEQVRHAFFKDSQVVG
jgi:hypothetical protein